MSGMLATTVSLVLPSAAEGVVAGFALGLPAAFAVGVAVSSALARLTPLLLSLLTAVLFAPVPRVGALAAFGESDAQTDVMAAESGPGKKLHGESSGAPL